MIDIIRANQFVRALCIATTLIEVGAGLVLACVPARALSLLFGASARVEPTTLIICGLAGFALMALGGACWFAQYDAHSIAARGIIGGMLIYNLGTFSMLGFAGLRPGEVGILLWWAVVLHFFMLIWCVIALWATRKTTTV